MPPAPRNQRVPRAGATPTPAAASSLERPAAIDTQNWRRSSRRATEGRPGDRNAPRPHRSERRLRGSTATSLVEVLRRPLEPALDAATYFTLEESLRTEHEEEIKLGQALAMARVGLDTLLGLPLR